MSRAQSKTQASVLGDTKASDRVSFTAEEVGNLSTLIEAGARALAAQSQLNKAGEILLVSNVLLEKIKQLGQENAN